MTVTVAAVDGWIEGDNEFDGLIEENREWNR